MKKKNSLDKNSGFFIKHSFLTLVALSIFQTLILYSLYFFSKIFLKKIEALNDSLFRRLALKVLSSQLILYIAAIVIVGILDRIYEKKIYQRKEDIVKAIKDLDDNLDDQSKSLEVEKIYKEHRSKNYLIFTLVTLYIILLNVLQSFIREIRLILTDKLEEKFGGVLLFIGTFFVIFLSKLMNQFARETRNNLREKDSFSKALNADSYIDKYTHIKWIRFGISLFIFGVIATALYFVVEDIFFEWLRDKENPSVIKEVLNKILNPIIEIDGYKLKIFSGKVFLTILIEFILFFIVEWIVSEILKSKIYKKEHSDMVDLNLKHREENDKLKAEKKGRIVVQERHLDVKGRNVHGVLLRCLLAGSLTVFVSACGTLHSLDQKALINPSIMLLMIFCLTISSICVFYSVRYMNAKSGKLKEDFSDFKEYVAELPQDILSLFIVKRDKDIVQVI
jgi:hypothetical protein